MNPKRILKKRWALNFFKNSTVRNKGSFLIEATLTLFLFMLVVSMSLDLVRRAHFEVLLHHGAFMHARSRSLGLGSSAFRRELASFYQRSLGEKGGKNFMRKVRIHEQLCEEGLRSRFYIRYPALLTFPYRHYSKHHFEITKKCIFPF